MSVPSQPSRLWFEKNRAHAVVRLTNGEETPGWFFLATASARHTGAERVADLLNSAETFLPFELSKGGAPRTVLYNRSHVVSVGLFENEAAGNPAYDVARPRPVTMLLSTGQRITGVVRVEGPEGHNRLSDWLRQPATFQYVETNDRLFLVNTSHVLEVSEVAEA